MNDRNFSSFEWDENKDRINQKKHGVGFFIAQYAFADPNRVILEDLTHSTKEEKRYFCLGKLDEGILTVRFTYRNKKIRILARDIGARVKRFMKSKIQYEDGPIEEVQVVADFLPSPEELAFRDETIKVTIALSKKSVDFFKEQGAKNRVSYQKMIRRLLDEYAAHYAS